MEYIYLVMYQEGTACVRPLDAYSTEELAKGYIKEAIEWSIYIDQTVEKYSIKKIILCNDK